VSSETLETRTARLRRAHSIADSAENRLNAILFGSIPVSFRKPHMLIVPDGPLYLVPFAVLLTSAQADITESPSASVFLAKQTAHYSRSFTPLLVIADPAMPSNSLPELEFAHRDTAALANFVPASKLETLEKEKASSADFQRENLRRFGLIHIAAHAVVDMNHPTDSGVILSDGKLSSSVISTLSINARLVTLSACDTALGREVEGEGIMSLSRAFLYAGAGAVLSTLWPIDDQATSAFMQSFYASLLKKKMSASRALHEAQLHMKTVPAWSDPFYWAAFTLQGDSD
jgi:CHAT domain-containing protein